LNPPQGCCDIRIDGYGSSAPEETQPRYSPDISFDRQDAAAIHQALDQPGLRHREVLVLHFMEDFSVAETAAIVGCPEGTVKSRIYHAKKALKEILERGGYGT